MLLRFLTGFVAGATAGAVAVVLFAPERRGRNNSLIAPTIRGVGAARPRRADPTLGPHGAG